MVRNRLASALLVLALAACSTHAAKRPHIVVIIADDLGWGDVGFRDQDMITPNLDRMAKEGVLLDQSYMLQICSPSRAAFLSGKYPFKMGMQNGVLTALKNNSMPTDIRILPQDLKMLGYKSHFIGKWHLGFCAPEMTPTGRGFDEFYGMYNGKGDYFTHISKQNGYDMHHDIGNNRKADWSVKGDYSTEVFSNKAIEVLRKHNKDTPLFMVLSYQAVHGELQVPQRYVDKCKHVNWMTKDETKNPIKNRRLHCGLTLAMDEGIGNFTAALDTLGYGDDLITVFISDNGGPKKQGSSNWPLRGGKITLWEGGTRVVTIMQSKKHLPNAPYTWSGLHHAVDWYPTLLSAAGGDASQLLGLDGVDNWSGIKQQKKPEDSARQEFVYNIVDGLEKKQGSIDPKAALRYKNYKLMRGYGGGPSSLDYPPRGVKAPKQIHVSKASGLYHLYDLKADPIENNDLAKSSKREHQDMLNLMKKKLAEYEKELKPTPKSVQINAGKPKKHNMEWVTGWC